MKINKVPKTELTDRMSRFTSAMDKAYPDWEMCAIVGGMSMYYFTGTIQDGMILIERGKGAALWVRRSYERALLESEFENIKSFSSFKEVAASLTSLPETLYLDMSEATLRWYELFNKYLPFKKVLPADNIILGVRSVKSTYETELMRRAGKIVDRLLREELPSFLHAGISEAEFGAELFTLFAKNGSHCVSRFSMRNSDIILGHIGFAESSLYPSVFNGASGIVGISPAAPVLGSHDVLLKEGDLIYVDVGFGIEGYNVDKTLIYSFKKPQSEYVNEAHRHCLELERQAVSMLQAGVKPSVIYKTVCESVKPIFRDCFMGVPGRTVRFLGHGVGLYVDELPVIANGFDEPLTLGMTIAIEPKIGISGVGMVGSENTYLITETGAVSLTGEQRDIICI